MTKKEQTTNDDLNDHAVERAMREDATAQPFDDVQRPRHYNLHPSGYQCVDVNEWFSGNVAAAIKYLWRMDLKEQAPLRDLKKAAWYLEREQRRLAELDDYSGIFLPMPPALWVRLEERVARVCEHEGNTLLSCVLVMLMLHRGSHTEAVRPALIMVQSEIASEEKKASGT